MKEKELIDIWKKEESVAHIHGWDFSHIEGKYTEETDLPWNYQNIILDYLKPEMKLLDIDTGGGWRHFTAVSLRSSLNVPACRTDQKSEVLRYLRVGICVCRPMRVPQYG